MAMDQNKVFTVWSLGQGDTWDFYIYLDHYDPAVWTAKYIFQKACQENIEITSTPGEGQSFLFHVPAATTLAYPPGTYTVVAQISNGTDRYTLGTAEIIITPDPATMSGGDPRSFYRRALDDCEKALAEGACSDVTEYTIAGTTVKKDRAGLLKLRSWYASNVRAEQGKPAIGKVLYSL